MGADLSRSELQQTDFRSPWVVIEHDWAEITRQEGSLARKGGAILNCLTRLVSTNMSEAWMLQASLSGADLQGAKLRNANLPEVNLTGAHLPGAKMNGTGPRDANLSGADLSGYFGPNSTPKYPPQGLTQARLDQACADSDKPPMLDASSSLVWNDRPCP